MLKFICLCIVLGVSVGFAQESAGPYSVRVSREGPVSAAFRPVPVQWNLIGRDSLRFWVAEPVSYEILVTTITGKAIRSIRGMAREGWQNFDLSAASQSGACILRIKVGFQLVVAGKVLWPAGKV